MVVLPVEVTAPHPDAASPRPPDEASPRTSAAEPAPQRSAALPRPAHPATVQPAESAPQHHPCHPFRRFLLPALALLLAAPVLAAAHQARSTPFGDHVTVHARVAHEARPSLRTTRDAVEAYDAETGRPRWSYAREGRRPLAVVPARGEAIALWDDGLVTDTARDDGRAVRWHRALPGASPWLADHGGNGVLRPLGARMLAVVTPQRIAAYRIADGDLRWVLPARQGCEFAPARAVRLGTALLIAQPCPAGDATGSWTGEIIAVDDLGRITPDRTPLGNERHSA
ncbi:PQQ-binding-like beta-propeller repeat protein [Streptomyces sp. NBC_00035]|uniref:outer membrane protein assembly factor BamB family protein n=1 Tax=Streptomyces sp. NBC_00035 TaxID=2903614 RepID=UPI003249572D